MTPIHLLILKITHSHIKRPQDKTEKKITKQKREQINTNRMKNKSKTRIKPYIHSASTK